MTSRSFLGRFCSHTVFHKLQALLVARSKRLCGTHSNRKTRKKMPSSSTKRGTNSQRLEEQSLNALGNRRRAELRRQRARLPEPLLEPSSSTLSKSDDPNNAQQHSSVLCTSTSLTPGPYPNSPGFSSIHDARSQRYQAFPWTATDMPGQPLLPSGDWFPEVIDARSYYQAQLPFTPLVPEQILNYTGTQQPIPSDEVSWPAPAQVDYEPIDTTTGHNPPSLDPAVWGVTHSYHDAIPQRAEQSTSHIPPLLNARQPTQRPTQAGPSTKSNPPVSVSRARPEVLPDDGLYIDSFTNIGAKGRTYFQATHQDPLTLIIAWYPSVVQLSNGTLATRLSTRCLHPYRNAANSWPDFVQTQAERGQAYIDEETRCRDWERVAESSLPTRDKLTEMWTKAWQSVIRQEAGHLNARLPIPLEGTPVNKATYLLQGWLACHLDPKEAKRPPSVTIRQCLTQEAFDDLQPSSSSLLLRQKFLSPPMHVTREYVASMESMEIEAGEPVPDLIVGSKHLKTKWSEVV